MSRRAAATLRELERLLDAEGGDAGARRLACLAELERARLAGPAQVRRLHEALCFLRAYPRERAVLALAERMLQRFDRRRDLRRAAAALADSGIAGTELRYSFFAPMARWLARRHGERLAIDWRAFEQGERLKRWLYMFVLQGEHVALAEVPRGAREWVHALKREDESDAAFLVRRFDALGLDPLARQLFYEDLDLPLRLLPGPGGPSRTRARHGTSPAVLREGPLRRERPQLARAARTPPEAVREVPPREAERLIDLAREAMVTRSRDLDSFAFGDPRDVRMVECGDGLQLACIGLLPRERLLLEGLYGFLTLQSGVPIGYVLASALFRSSEVAYNVFESFRGGEAGHVYGRVLGAVRALLGSDSFTVYPYQLGHRNPEGIASGAWWFYQKLGYRARDPQVLALMERELAATRRDRSHRSSPATLRRLARANVFWSLGRARRDVIGAFPTERVSLAISAFVSERYGGERERALRECSAAAGRLLRCADRRSWSAEERAAFERWSVLVPLLGVERWKPAERRALARVIRAKGGRRESDYVRLFDAHARLRRALGALARRGSGARSAPDARGV